MNTQSVRHPATLLYAAAGALLLAACASGGSAGSPPTAPGPVGSTPPGSTTAWPEPISVRSSRGMLNVEMNVVMASLNVPGDGVQNLRAWQLVSANGVSYADSANNTAFPGPTFRVRPGDTVRILLHNNLPAGNSNENCAAYPAVASGVDNFQDCFHGYNWTNIHY